jgi:hypothetical protein
MKHLVFLCAPSGYGLDEREGDAPEVGSEVDDVTGRFVVTKVAASPLPGDSRRCAYLQPA